MSIKEFAEQYMKAEDEAWYNDNFDLLEEMDHPNAKYHFFLLGQEINGWEEHKQQIIDIKKAISDYHHELKFLTGEGNYFALSYKMDCRYTSQIPGMPPATGQKVSESSLFLYKLKDGKVAEAWINGTIKFE